MKRFFALVTLGFFLIVSMNILTACKQKPKEEPAIEKGAKKADEIEKAEEPEVVTPAPVPVKEPAPAEEVLEEQPTPEQEAAPMEEQLSEQPQEQPQTPGQ